MTMDERIEAAAWAAKREDEKYGEDTPIEACLKEAREWALELFPELFADPPTHKIVPWEATSEMAKAWEAAYESAPQGSGIALAWEAAYLAMLDVAP